MTKVEKPVFKHDCECCNFLGHWVEQDLYFCGTNGGAGPTVIARFSSDGPDYSSGLKFADHFPHLREARDRAVKKGLLKAVF